MAKAKNLAGLAALGALGYMLTRGKKGETVDSNPDRGAGYQSTETRLESPEDTIRRSMAKAPEAEDANYGNEHLRTSLGVAPMARVKPRVSPAAVADNTTGITMPTGSPDAEASMTRGIPKVKGAGVSSSAEGMKNYKPRSTPAPLAAKTKETPMSPKKPYMPEEVDMGYKNGGKTKKMASGGMTSKVSSASKRADGIASRGKTKCKMY
jgi:hypothetical protein